MLEAVRGDGCALQFASDELRADPEESFFSEGGEGWCGGVVLCLGKTMGGEKVMLSFFGVGGWVGGSSVGLLVFIDWHWCCIVFSVGKSVVLILSVSRQFSFFYLTW